MATPGSFHKSDLLGIFAHHKVAANLLMLMMLLSGAFALSKLNIQFFPNATLDVITVRVVWTGASAEDVEVGITTPLEQRLKVIDNLNKLTSTSAQGVSSLTLEFEDNTDMVLALDQVRREVDGFRNLPQEAEKPVIVAHEFENELLARGIDKIDITGLPEQEISIEIPSRRLNELQLSLDDVATKVDSFSQDIPAGIIGDAVAAKELRSLDQRRSESEFAKLPLVSDENRLIRLGDVADISRKPQDGSVLVEYRGQPAINMTLQRAEKGNSLEAAQILDSWLEETGARLPGNIEITLVRPTSNVFSNPPMSDTEAFSYLLLGRSLEGATSGDGAMLMSVAKTLGMEGGSGFLSNLGAGLGLDEATITTSEGFQNSQLKLGKRIGENLYLKYMMGLVEDFQTVAIEYRINNNFRAEAETGTETGADLIYRIER
jgi:multidrug efflux pump subunit AcrB